MTPGLDDMTPTEMADTSGDAFELGGPGLGPGPGAGPGAEEAMAEDLIDV